MPLDILAGITAARHGSELLKNLREALTKPDIDHPEVTNKLIEIQGLIMDAQTALIEAQAEKQKMQAEISTLRRTADIGKNFKSADGVYWFEQYPYCPVCWDVDRKPVRLAGPTKPPFGRDEHWTCPLHRHPYAMSYNARSTAPA